MNNFSNEIKPLLLSGLMMLSTSLANGVVWQWPAEGTSVVSDETNAHPRAFLWIPENFKSGYIDAWGRGTIKIIDTCKQAELHHNCTNCTIIAPFIQEHWCKNNHDQPN
jgi:hypothetical protein